MNTLFEDLNLRKSKKSYIAQKKIREHLYKWENGMYLLGVLGGCTITLKAFDENRKIVSHTIC